MRFAVVSSLYRHPINRARREQHDRYLHLRRLSSLDGFGAAGGNWIGYWGKQGPELLDHRLALYGEEQRMVFGATTYRAFAWMPASSTEESEVRDPWVTRGPPCMSESVHAPHPVLQPNLTGSSR
jgi:hypothetical protein